VEKKLQDNLVKDLPKEEKPTPKRPPKPGYVSPWGNPSR
jgi:hypothetical protein